MQGSSQEECTERTREWKRERRAYRKLFIAKCGIGIVLFLLGVLAGRYTSGQTDTFGPPYFFGAFIVGCSMILAGFVNILIYRHSSRAQKLSQYFVIESVFTVIGIIGGIFGIVFVSIFGIPRCEPIEPYKTCNYTKHLSTNRNIAIAILIFLLVSEIIAIASILIHCREASQQRLKTRQNVYYAGSAGNVDMAPASQPNAVSHHSRDIDNDSGDTYVFIDGHVVKKTRGGLSETVIHSPQKTVIHEPVGYGPAPGPSLISNHSRDNNNDSGDTYVFIDGHVVKKTRGGLSETVIHSPQKTIIRKPVGYGPIPGPSPVSHHSHDNNNDSGDTYVFIDGHVVKKTRGGLSETVIHSPPQRTIIPEPARYPQCSGPSKLNTQYRPEGQSFASDESINRLQEQNRLLREHITLQQQLQLIQQQNQQQQQQQQQQQHVASSSALPPPPPSYESCMQDPAQVTFLQEQNEELRHRCLSQKEEMAERVPLTGYRDNTPSAPPL